MTYHVFGEFIEACDCEVVCPCWVDQDPQAGHCTGVFAWLVADGSRIDAVDVSGRIVVAVTTHLGKRGVADSATAVFVDQGADRSQFNVLADAFTGQADGPLADLAAVSGDVLARRQAQITVDQQAGVWRVGVTTNDPARVPLVRATGSPQMFSDTGPLMLEQTALHAELGLGAEPVTVQLGDELDLQVASLAGGYLTVTGRSGMRGRFDYRWPTP